MNTKSIRFILGWILNIEALLMLLPVATAVVYREEEGVADRKSTRLNSSH